MGGALERQVGGGLEAAMPARRAVAAAVAGRHRPRGAACLPAQALQLGAFDMTHAAGGPLTSRSPPAPPCCAAQLPMLGRWSDLHGRRPFFLVALLGACLPLGVVLAHVLDGFPLKWYYIVQVIRYCMVLCMVLHIGTRHFCARHAATVGTAPRSPGLPA